MENPILIAGIYLIGKVVLRKNCFVVRTAVALSDKSHLNDEYRGLRIRSLTPRQHLSVKKY